MVTKELISKIFAGFSTLLALYVVARDWWLTKKHNALLPELCKTCDLEDPEGSWYCDSEICPRGKGRDSQDV